MTLMFLIPSLALSRLRRGMRLRLASLSFIAVALVSLFPSASAADNSQHHLFVYRDGSLWAWGGNSFGQLGLGIEAESAVTFPAKVNSATKFSSASAGLRHTLALDRDGFVWTWGDNSAGQLGTGSFKPSSEPQRPNLKDVAAVAAGEWHSVALDNSGQVWMWGSNVFGQLGKGKSGHFAVSAVPTKVGGLPKAVAISSGNNHVLVRCADGTVWSWGRNLEGQVDALGKERFFDRPLQLPGPSAVVRVRALKNASHAVADKDMLWGWGDGFSRAGNQKGPQRMEAAALPSLESATEVIGGQIRAGGRTVQDVAISIDGRRCGQSDGGGYYRCIVPRGYEGMLSAQKNGLTFRPLQVGKTERTSLHIIAQAQSVKVSGRILSAGQRPVQGVELSGAGARCNQSNAQGEFLCEVPQGWSGRLQGKNKDGLVSEFLPIAKVTEPLGGLTFMLAPSDSASAATPVKSSPPAETGQPLKHEPVQTTPAATVVRPTEASVAPALVNVQIGGVVNAGVGRPIQDVVISGDHARCSPSNARGEYTCSVPYGWTGRLMPSKRNYKFSPGVILFSDIRDDRRLQDFHATFSPQ